MLAEPNNQTAQRRGTVSDRPEVRLGNEDRHLMTAVKITTGVFLVAILTAFASFPMAVVAISTAFASLPMTRADRVPTPDPVSGRNSGSIEAILPSDVLARTKLVRAEVELLRLEMGMPESEKHGIVIKFAAPREVYFQALTLFSKANRLSFELTGTLAREPDVPLAHLIKPSHVWDVVNESLKRILLTKKIVGIADI